MYDKHNNPISNHLKPKKPEHKEAFLKFGEHKLEVLDAQGPSIINWEHMKYNAKDRAVRKHLSLSL